MLFRYALQRSQHFLCAKVWVCRVREGAAWLLCGGGVVMLCDALSQDEEVIAKILQKQMEVCHFFGIFPFVFLLSSLYLTSVDSSPQVFCQENRVLTNQEASRLV